MNGKHLLINGTSKMLNNEKLLKNVLFNAIKKSGNTILTFSEFSFYPQGYSAIFLLAESHCSIHTYPEQDIVYIDFFGCGVVDIKEFENHIVNALKIKITFKDLILR